MASLIGMCCHPAAPPVLLRISPVENSKATLSDLHFSYVGDAEATEGEGFVGCAREIVAGAIREGRSGP